VQILRLSLEVGGEAFAKAWHGPCADNGDAFERASLHGDVVVKFPPIELWRFVCSLAYLASSLVVGGLLAYCASQVWWISVERHLGAGRFRLSRRCLVVVSGAMVKLVVRFACSFLV
jgi:hypothetical protein